MDWEKSVMLGNRFMTGEFIVPTWKSRKIHKVKSRHNGYYIVCECGYHEYLGRCGYSYATMINDDEGSLCKKCFR